MRTSRTMFENKICKGNPPPTQDMIIANMSNHSQSVLKVESIGTSPILGDSTIDLPNTVSISGTYGLYW